MLRVDTNSMIAGVADAVRRQVARREGEPVDTGAVRQGIRVSLSDLGKPGRAQKNDDIEKSSLPDGIKELLKMIRELKAQVARGGGGGGAGAAQQRQAREEADPTAVFAVDISQNLKLGMVEGSPSAMVTIVEAWDFA